MAATQVGQLTGEWLVKWRDVCAGFEVAQSGNPNLSVRDAEDRFVLYYETIDEIHTEFGIEGFDRDAVTIYPASGRVVLEDD